MRRLFMAVVGVVLAAVLSGCGGSGSPAVSETSGSPAVTPAATLRARGGLVGAIDSARKLAVCENVRLYLTAVEGGLSAAADEAFDATLETLRQAPRDPALLALAAHWQLIRERLGDGRAADRLRTFCG